MKTRLMIKGDKEEDTIQGEVRKREKRAGGEEQRWRK